MTSNNQPDDPQRGFVSLVGAGPGDPELITLKGLRRIQSASVIVYDRLAPQELLEYARDARSINVGKKPHQGGRRQSRINDRIIQLAREGHHVVRLKGGDPCIFGRGGEEAQALVEAGIPFEMIPGVTSAVGVPTSVGVPLTHRDHAGSVAILTGHRRDNPERELLWKDLARGADTIVLLMSVKKLRSNLKRLRQAGLTASTPALAISHGTTPRQELIFGTLETLPERAEERGLEAPATIVVGQVVSIARQVGAGILTPLSRAH